MGTKVQNNNNSVQVQDEDFRSGFCTFEHSNKSASPDLWRFYLGNHFSDFRSTGLVNTLPVIVHQFLAFDLGLRHLVHLRFGHLQSRSSKKSMVASAQDMEILRSILSGQVDQNGRVGSGTQRKLFIRKSSTWYSMLWNLCCLRHRRLRMGQSLSWSHT